jgi:hypothetical protein
MKRPANEPKKKRATKHKKQLRIIHESNYMLQTTAFNKHHEVMITPTYTCEHGVFKSLNPKEEKQEVKNEP